MQEKSSAVVFVGCGYNMGGVLFLAHMGVALSKSVYGSDFFFGSLDCEAQEGYWDLVHRNIRSDRVVLGKDFDELSTKLVGLAKFYDKVLVHTAGGWGQTKHFMRARRKIGKELSSRLIFVCTTHSYRNDSLLRWPVSALLYVLYRMYYRLVIFQCKDAADKFCGGNNLIKKGKAIVLPLGCEPFDKSESNVPKKISENECLVKVLEDQHLFKFVYLAAFRPGKMHVWLIKAFSAVLKRNLNSRVLLCGTGDRKVISKVKHAIKVTGLSNQVILTGQIPRNEIPWLLSHCNCAVVPSRAETFGHNFLEPMFAGIPVLGTSVGIGIDIIRDGETGYHFSLNDRMSFVRGADRMMKDRKQARLMGEKAYNVVMANFSHSVIAERLSNLYSHLLRENI